MFGFGDLKVRLELEGAYWLSSDSGARLSVGGEQCGSFQVFSSRRSCIARKIISLHPNKRLASPFYLLQCVSLRTACERATRTAFASPFLNSQS